MSVINDALKKAEKEKQISQNRPLQVFSKIDEIKTGVKKYVLKGWFVWAGAGVLCYLGIILLTSSFKQPADSLSVQEITPSSGSTPSFFQLRKIDVETPLDSSGFQLSGVLYDNQKSLAIINDRVVEEGALINGAKLLEIQPNSVNLSLNGKEFTLKIK